ncbi:MAG: hypothetical protein WAK55_00345 [Xanthobacteraceae bacterium]
MTSESDNKAGRRPPTIELTATEVGNSQSPASAGAEPAAEPAAPRDMRGENHAGSENETRSENESSRERAAESRAAESNAPGSDRHRTSHAVSALLGAVVAAAVIGGVWLAGFVPSRNAATPAEPMAGPSPATHSADADITARLDKIERAIQAQQQPDAAMGSRIAAVEEQTKSLGTSIATLGGRLDEIASSSQSAVKQADAAHAAAEAATKTNQATNQAMSQNTAQRGDIEGLTNRIVTLEDTVKTLTAAATEAAPETDDRPARLSVAAEALRATVERGAAYQAELAAVQALGVDRAATAPLQPFAGQGVPSVSALARELTALAAALEGAAEPAATDATFLDRLKANAQKLVRVTPAGAPPGNDPADVIARIRFDAAHGDIDAALADIKQLPDPVKALAGDWIKIVQSRDAAVAASRRIATDALAALSKPSDQ